MIEFSCVHCKTYLSIAVEQIGDEIFCPSCEKEIHLPELSDEIEEQMNIALAQAKTGPIKKIDTQKLKKLLSEPDSEETKLWKENLAKSFQTKSFKTADTGKQEIKTEASNEGDSKNKKSGIRKIFAVFSKK